MRGIDNQNVNEQQNQRPASIAIVDRGVDNPLNQPSQSRDNVDNGIDNPSHEQSQSIDDQNPAQSEIEEGEIQDDDPEHLPPNL